MSSSRDILLFSTADWDNPFWTNKQHMASLFARNGYRVLYVDSLGLRRPTLHKRDLARIARRLWKSVPLSRQVLPGLWRVSPLVLPFGAGNWVEKFNYTLLKQTILWHMKMIGMTCPLIWTYNPVMTSLYADLPNAGIVYHCVDDLRAAPGISADAITRGEEALGRMAGLCFTTSPLLRDRMQPLFPKVVYEPNVADQAMFAKAKNSPAEPDDIKGIPHPRLLFVGALSEYKVNFQLMSTVARQSPDLHWILVGAQGEGQPGSSAPPDDLPNVHVMGPRAYRILPSYMAHADVAVLPAPHNEYTAAMFPMKFFEYLSAGLQVVSTSLPALAGLEDVYFPADSPEEFTAAVRKILAGEKKDPSRIEAICARHTWEARFFRMEAEVRAI